MTQEGGGEDVIMQLQIAANSAADEGVQLYGHIDAIQPAMTPRTGAGVVPRVIVFNVMIHGRSGQGVAQRITK